MATRKRLDGLKLRPAAWRSGGEGMLCRVAADQLHAAVEDCEVLALEADSRVGLEACDLARMAVGRLEALRAGLAEHLEAEKMVRGAAGLRIPLKRLLEADLALDASPAEPEAPRQPLWEYTDATFADAAHEYLRYREREIASRAKREEHQQPVTGLAALPRRVIERHLVPWFADRPLAEIRPETLDEYRAWLRQPGPGQVSARGSQWHMAVLGIIFRHADECLRGIRPVVSPKLSPPTRRTPQP